MNIKYRDDLLQLVIDGINKYKDKTIASLEVVLYKDKEAIFTADLATTLNYLINDIYWNEEGDWSDANLAEVRVM